MPNPMFTEQEWRSIRLRVLKRALELSRPYPYLWKVGVRARDLAQQAIAKGLEPSAKPWDPARHRTFGDHLCDIVWSLHGHELDSYRVVMASHEVTDEMIDRGGPVDAGPEALLVDAGDNEVAQRRRAALALRVKGDTLIELLLAAKDDQKAGAPTEERREKHEVRAPAEELEVRVKKDASRALDPRLDANLGLRIDPRSNAEPASTRAALAKGYSLKDIKNARERLKRHAQAVVQEEAEVKS